MTMQFLVTLEFSEQVKDADMLRVRSNVLDALSSSVDNGPGLSEGDGVCTTSIKVAQIDSLPISRSFLVIGELKRGASIDRH